MGVAVGVGVGVLVAVAVGSGVFVGVAVGLGVKVAGGARVGMSAAGTVGKMLRSGTPPQAMKFVATQPSRPAARTFSQSPVALRPIGSTRVPLSSCTTTA